MSAAEEVKLPTRPKRYSTEIGVLQNQVPGRRNTWSKTSEDENGDEIDAQEFVVYADEIERQLLEARKEIARLTNLLQKTVHDHVKREEKLFLEMGLSTREGRHFNERAEQVESLLKSKEERIGELEKLLRDGLDFMLICNSQDPDLHEEECPRGYINECGTCEHRHAVQDALTKEPKK